MHDNCWNIIISDPNSGYANMALDEAIFVSAINGTISRPILRIYSWSEPCITIGYFQKYAEQCEGTIPIIRRLTGGLKVRHRKDIAYSLIVSSSYLPCIHHQEETYRQIHSAFCTGLHKAGIAAYFCAPGREQSVSNLCTETMFSHDLLFNGIKILGSCQRKRGKVLLQQGSIHLPSTVEHLSQTIVPCLVQGFEQFLNIRLNKSTITGACANLSDELENAKYRTSDWNMRF